MTKLKKYGTTRNGWCPPTHVFRSQSYLWSSRRITVLFLHPVPYPKIGKLNYINNKFNTNQIMAAKTPSHHQVLLKQLGKTNVHNIEEICLHSNTSRLLSVHVRGNKKGKGQRAKGKGQRAKGKGQRAKGKGQRAKGKGQRTFCTDYTGTLHC
jgi:hypothetical protein